MRPAGRQLVIAGLDSRLTCGCELSALRAGYALLPRKKVFICSWYSFLLESEKTPGPSAAGRIMQFERSPESDI
jgi:hypothetical protein